MADEKVFSDYEIKETSIKFEGDEKADRIGCVGTLNETKNIKTVTKKCEGVIKKQRTRGDGTATVKMNLHMRAPHLYKALGMDVKGLKKGVYAYGTKSIHKEAVITGKIYDEDGKEKLLAYPRFVITSAFGRTITNGAEEVEEIEIEGTALSDDYEMCVYEALMSEVTDVVEKTWMETFTSELGWETVSA